MRRLYRVTTIALLLCVPQVYRLNSDDAYHLLIGAKGNEKTLYWRLFGDR